MKGAKGPLRNGTVNYNAESLVELFGLDIFVCLCVCLGYNGLSSWLACCHPWTLCVSS